MEITKIHLRNSKSSTNNYSKTYYDKGVSVVSEIEVRLRRGCCTANYEYEHQHI